MAIRSILVTGANRGIGLGIVKEYLKLDIPPVHLIATFRDPGCSEELLKIAEENDRVHALQLDVAHVEEHPDFVKKVADIVGPENGLNLLINNAGYLSEKRDLESVTAEEMAKSFQINCIAPLLLTREFLPLLKAAIKDDKPKFKVSQAASILMSTAVSSITENTGGGLYAYRSSKSALNMAMKSLAVDLKDTGILIMAMHPGWVKTRMGGENALIDVDTCVSTMLKTLDELDEKDHGTLKRYNNTEIPW